MEPLNEIKKLYYNTTRTTVQRDLTRAITLLKALSEDDRERAAVYMDGLSQMRSEWGQGTGTRDKGDRPRAKGQGATHTRKP